MSLKVTVSVRSEQLMELLDFLNSRDWYYRIERGASPSPTGESGGQKIVQGLEEAAAATEPGSLDLTTFVVDQHSGASPGPHRKRRAYSFARGAAKYVLDKYQTEGERVDVDSPELIALFSDVNLKVSSISVTLSRLAQAGYFYRPVRGIYVRTNKKYVPRLYTT